MAERREAPTSVYVADDHPMYRTGIVRLLQDAGLVIVGQAADGRLALREIKALKPDVAVLDVQMPDLDGIRVLEALRLEKAATRVVLLSGFFDSDNVYEAVTCGVAALVTKTSGSDYILNAVSSAAQSDTAIISPELMAGFTSEVRRRQGTDERAQSLSQREIQVIRLMARGHSRREMAHRLEITQATVKYHIGNLYAKLNVNHATAAVAEAMRSGLLD